MNFNSLIIPFITGGIIVASVKYISTTMGTKLAAIVGGFPIGLFSIYFLTDKQAYGYGQDYGIITAVLLLSVIIFNVLYKYVKLSKETAYIISLLIWFGLATLRMYL